MAAEQGSVNDLSLDWSSVQRVLGGFAWTPSAISASTSTTWRPTAYQIGQGWEEAGEAIKIPEALVVGEDETGT